MIPESLTVLELQELRYRLAEDIKRLLREFVQRTGVIAHVDKCHAGPRFDDDTVEIDVCVYCGLSDGLEAIRPPKERNSA